ncbi:MAG: peptide ABC transporter substrate-binding protein [Chlamydiae bacterium]|nr:peptide ABC transporter substrate-binding protein [Chlamydiota bacterium]
MRHISYILSTSLILFLGGCASKPKAKHERKKSLKVNLEQVISLNIVSEPQTLDPRKVRSLSCINLARMFGEGLTRVGKNGMTELALAESVKISEDKKTYTFKLKHSFWSNGDPLTAEDFIYAWKKSLSPSFPSDNAFLLYAIKNGKSIKNGELPTSFLGAYAVSEDTIVVELEHPVPYLLELTSLPIFFPVNGQYEKEHPHWNMEAKSFICNGPFLLHKWSHSNEIIAVKNPNYWDKEAVKLEKIKMLMVNEETGFKMFENKELHWEGSPFSSVPIDAINYLTKEGKISSDPLLGTYWIRTNTSKFPCNKTEVRRALALAIDRNSIVEHITQGHQIPATGIVPVSMGLQQKPYFADGSIEKALELFEHALTSEQISSHDLPDLTIMYVADQRNHRIAQAIQDQWKSSLGIKAKLDPVEAKVFFDRMSKKDYQLACGSWIADFNDPINFLEVFKSKNIGTNNTNWESPDYAKALEASYLSSTPEERREHLQYSEKLLIDAMPVIPIFHYTMLHMQNQGLKDVVLSESGHIDFKWAHLEEDV